MNRIGLNFMIILTSVSLFGIGCAKKHKPDVDELANNLIQDKDMNFEAIGSDSGKIEGLYTIHFDYDKYNLTEENRNLLVKDANWLKSHSKKSLQIEGHCDRHGSIEYNMALGQRRADAVRHYLLDLGINKERLSTISYGKEKMFDSAETDEADVQNRRANFKPIDIPMLNRMSNL